jgi:hypothetical protein
MELAINSENTFGYFIEKALVATSMAFLTISESYPLVF